MGRAIVSGLLAFLVIVGLAYLLAHVEEAFFAPEPVQPYSVVQDDGTLVRYSFVPHHSFLRGVSWYDRVVEEYISSDGEFVLTRKVVGKYHYPLFGLGEMWIEEIVLFDGS